MSSPFNSPADEFGTDGVKASLRALTDIADDKGTYYLLKDEISSVTRSIGILQDKPLIFRAGSNINITGNIIPWIYNGIDPMFGTFPLKEGTITGFVDNTTDTIVNTKLDHNLNVGDVVKIIDSRIGVYLGTQVVTTVPSSTQFTINETFAGVDGQCTFVQTQLAIFGTADSVTDPGVKTTLTMTNHNLDDDISINIANSLGDSMDGTFIISNITTDTVDIEFVFSTTTTARANIGINSLEMSLESLDKLGSVTDETVLFDLQANATLVESSFFVNNSKLSKFTLGRTIGFGGTNIANGTSFIDSTGLLVVDSGFVSMKNGSAITTEPVTGTNQFRPCMRIAPHTDPHRTVTVLFNNITFQQYNSFIEIPALVNEDAAYSIIGNTTVEPGTLFSLGNVVRANATAIADEGGGTIEIFIDDTERFRDGDEIEILESENYAGLICNIEPGGVEFGVGIIVDIPFVAGDTAILFRNNTLGSKDETDPQVASSSNGDIEDSTVSANAFLPFDANLTVPITAAATPVPIGGIWTFTELERLTGNTSGGISTSTSVEKRRIMVSFGGTVSGPGSASFAFHIFKNGINITDTPPIVELANANTPVTVGAIQITTMEKGDNFQVYISNPFGTQDPTVHASHKTISKI